MIGQYDAAAVPKQAAYNEALAQRGGQQSGVPGKPSILGQWHGRLSGAAQECHTLADRIEGLLIRIRGQQPTPTGAQGSGTTAGNQVAPGIGHEIGMTFESLSHAIDRLRSHVNEIEGLA